MIYRHLPGLCFLVLLSVASIADAGVPRQISYQGRMTDDIGIPVNTTADLTFIIYADIGGATALWNETHLGVTIVEGLFEVVLGSDTPIPDNVFNGDERWLGVQLEEGGPLSTPLTPIVSTAYAMRSRVSDTASYAHAAPSSGAGGWTDDGNVVRLTNEDDSVGIGTADPRVPLEVEGSVSAIIGHSLGSGTAFGVLGGNDNDGIGVMGTSSSGNGVHGISWTGFSGYFFGPKGYFSANLGVGTETPEEMLHVYRSSSGAECLARIQSAHPSSWGMTGLQLQTPRNLWSFRMEDDASFDVPSGGLGLRSEYLGGDVMTWTEEGQVGIGNTSPSYGLDVDASSDALRVHGGSGFTGYFSGAKTYFGCYVGIGTQDPSHELTLDGDFAIQSGGTTRFHINYYNGGLNFSETTVADYRLNIETGGNVGVGTGNPQEKLHVAGNARVDGMLMADEFEVDAINRYNIVDEVGLASAVSTSLVYLTNSPTSYLSKTIIVPTAGYILAIGMVHASLEHDISGSSGASIGISDMPDDFNGGTAQSFHLDGDVPSGNYRCSIPCRRLSFVESAGAYTYYLLAIRYGDNTASISQKQMDLLFIPTAYGSKNLADGSDGDVAIPLSIVSGQRGAGAGLGDRQRSDSEISKLQAEIAELRQTVAEMNQRLNDTGR